MLIDPKSSTPIFRQIADQLRRAIDSGVYKPGEQLPSLRAMAVDIKVNPNTVQRAYDALEREGVVETRRGIGIFVVSANRNRMNAAEERLSNQPILFIFPFYGPVGLSPSASMKSERRIGS
jgi:GntR family transcriptional regulator